MCFVRQVISLSFGLVAACAEIAGYESLRGLARAVDYLPEIVETNQDCSFLPRLFEELVPTQFQLVHLVGCYEWRIYVNLTEDSRECRQLAASVIQLTLTDGELVEIPSLFDFASLQFQAVPFLIAFPNLQSVSFAHNKIQKIQLDTFSYNLQLRELYLNSNEIEAIQSGAFKKLTLLTTLNLSKNKLFEVPALLPLSLLNLDLSDNQLERVAPHTIEENVKRLESLNLCGNNLKPRTSLNHLEFGNLRRLCLGSAGIGFPLQNNEILNFHLVNLTLSSEGSLHWSLNASSLSAIRKLLRLQELNIEHFKVESLEFLHPLSKLEVLMMKSVSFVQVYSLPGMFFINKSQLKIVDLEQSPKLATILLSHLAKLPHLEKLSLRRTELKTLPADPFITAKTVRLDLSMNPLHCTEDFQWVLDQCEQRRPNGDDPILISPDITCCDAPYRLEGVELRCVEDFGGLESNSTSDTKKTDRIR
ncbi:unnamed protein product [Bemisia tabaci]|uniref:Uncharacterized protein n=1 Tax=Bemisia tabaci TaxID=7038 RepID=A0A9P0AKA3_BEMTA|nr:unnamed protein product [Bemisia tabaci]